MIVNYVCPRKSGRRGRDHHRADLIFPDNEIRRGGEGGGRGADVFVPRVELWVFPSSARVCKHVLGEAASGLFVAACMDGGMERGISLFGLEAFANNKCFAI